MEKVVKWTKNEFINGYNIFEIGFMISMVLLQIVVFILYPDSWISLITGVTGAISVVLCAKGKFSFYWFGYVQLFGYLYLSWHARFYGEVIENIFYLATMVWGMIIWKNNMVSNKTGSTQVRVKAFSAVQWVLASVFTIVATGITGYVLALIGSAQAYTDAATNVFAIFGQILMVKRYKEQWIWWLLVDLFCIKLWLVAGNWSMVAMYVGWTINCLYGWYNWSKLYNTSE